MNLYIPNPKTNIQLAPTPFAAGGESELYAIVSPNTFTNLVAKVLLPNKRSLDKRRKIEYLIANAPDNQANAHPDVIWAKYILEDERGAFVGYLMDKAEGEKLELLCTNKIPKPFLHKWGRFALDLPESRLLRLKICYNLCVAVEKMHRKGYVLADLKPENVMIQPDGRVSVIDTDSVQVVENQKILFPANVATPEYTPAESYHTAQLPIDKRIISKTWDEFSIAVIQYRILFGIHPFTATSAGRYEHCTDLQQKIQCGLFVHSPNHQAFISKMPAPHAAYTSCPAALKDYFCASLAANPAERLPLQTWIPMLQKVITLANVNVVKVAPVITQSVVVPKPVVPIIAPPALPVVAPKPIVVAPVVVVQTKAFLKLNKKDLIFGGIILCLLVFALSIKSLTKKEIKVKYDYTSDFYEGLAVVKKNGKWGYIDIKGNEIIPCLYDDSGWFYNDLAVVKKNEKWGYIDIKGNEIIPFIYEHAGDFSEGLARVKKNGKWGFVNTKGNEVIPFIYEHANNFSEGLAVVTKDGAHFYEIDKTGKCVSDCVELDAEYSDEFLHDEEPYQRH